MTIVNGGGYVKMKSRRIFLTLAVLLCLTAQIYTLSSIAKGQCGTNPLGDTSGDTDFYVSKNQNAAASSMSSAAASGPGKATVALGSKTVATSQNSTIQSLNPDKPSPQSPGVAIVWKVEAMNPNNEEMQYSYLLKGPATGDMFLDKTGWISESAWTWNTTDADVGENQIEVRVMRAGANGFEHNMTESFIVSAPIQDSETAAIDTVDTTAVDTASVASAPDTSSANEASNVVSKTVPTEVNPRPASKTADIEVGKPRVAPDERPRQPSTTTGGLIPGPNMSMPDPSPKSPSQTSSESAAQSTETGVVPPESRIMEVSGKWTVRLENEGATINPLTLIQTGEKVMGMGTLNEQNAKLQVSAKGYVSSDAMNLDIWTIVSEYGNKIDKRIELELVQVDRVLSGSYEIYSDEELIGKGNATASRSGA
jgi:hypothetical protein